jgi:hypothetical protein
LADELGSAFETLLTGAVPIVGMLAYGWSANQLLLFLLVGAWTAILLDITKFFLFYGAVKRFGAAHYDDWHVWVVAGALRKGENEAVSSHLKAKYQPEMGVVVDLLFGGVATLLIIVAIEEGSAQGIRELLADRSVLYGLAGLVTYQVVFAAWEMFRRVGDDSGPMKVAVGMRGFGLFVLLFVVVMIRESAGANGSIARTVMLVVNGALVALALFNAVGQFWVNRETAWLRDYLRTRPPAEKAPARKRRM